MLTRREEFIRNNTEVPTYWCMYLIYCCDSDDNGKESLMLLLLLSLL